MKIKAIAITISDSRNQSNDFSGKVLVECLQTIDAEVIDKIIVSDDIDEIIQALKNSAKKANLIITTGGTGFAQRDNTPEATRQVIEKEAQGLAELIRLKTSENTQFAWLSRGVCGILGNCLIINFPGSPKAVKECFQVIKPLLPHAINLIQGKTQH
jgi:molybdopterin adenylyltransferase